MYKRPPRAKRRLGVILVLSALLMVAVCGMAAMGIDVGFMMLVKTQLQVAADAGALAAANSLHLSQAEIIDVGEQFVAMHNAGGRAIKTAETNVEIGVWDIATDVFTPAPGVGNAVRVTVTRDGEALFFGRVIGNDKFNAQASAIAMANPKDIAFVIDLSGSMNDDTEPAWATTTINTTFGAAAASGVATSLMQDVYDDFGFGAFPGTLEYLGGSFGLPKDHIAYAELTSDVGPLANGTLAPRYRIAPGDSEHTRRERAYCWIIDHQLRNLMPKVRPFPNSKKNYEYWEKYIDYVLLTSHVVSPSPPPPPSPPPTPNPTPSPSPTPTPTPGPPPPPPAPTPPIGMSPWRQFESFAATPATAFSLWSSYRSGGPAMLAAPAYSVVYGPSATGPGLPRVGGLYGNYSAWIPPSQDGDRIYQFNNPNRSSFPSADGSLPHKLRNYFGYLTYVQFLMDHGRDLQPDGNVYTELSLDSGLAPLHSESVAGRSFSFPPRSQPLHAVRRSAIAALDVVDDRNSVIPTKGARDQVAIVTFDTTDGSRLLHTFTPEYLDVMESVTKLQAVGDKGTSTATETGLIHARQLLLPKSKGGAARERSTKVAVLLTDGMPNAHSSDAGTIDSYMTSNSIGDSYGGGYYWLDAALMQTHVLEADGIEVYPVGIGMGADYDFMDRVSRLGGTGGADGQSPRGSGNPAEYELLLTKIFEDIVKKPTARLVE
ncbi:von Willebrand factor type A domain protein [Posidoniimonas polymericola]|uniref:von Willebrand factor type A domain protein n=1 Tax=Posidoniimonas polymericola TaxID=2528002 RepID=A0A5C5XWG1_9BACT|nr:TadG family pilus assembly protein [Posidoniimonas polymericola]TWT66988.1 von Willebrand factor type A domain protein [Posidoniimonas polymericola]